MSTGQTTFTNRATRQAMLEFKHNVSSLQCRMEEGNAGNSTMDAMGMLLIGMRIECVYQSVDEWGMG